MSPVSTSSATRDDRVRRIERERRHLGQRRIGGDRLERRRVPARRSSICPLAANADPRAKCQIARVKSVSCAGFGSARISSQRPNRTIAKYGTTRKPCTNGSCSGVAGATDEAALRADSSASRLCPDIVAPSQTK